ncbi:PREDICTED: hemocytin [Polistes dominula]|uniref:Hemocytin n=1 Tax=Polistes dominula TaxID=743375 RepID=A0ABM1IA24_POLDO|nr:PREDICTED: hemocytin [Polistes dominula]
MILGKLLLLFIAIVTVTALTQEENELERHERTIFDSIVKTKNVKRKKSYVGGCTEIPDPPVNGNIRCSIDSGCIARCQEGHQFPNGVNQLAVTCSNKKWYVAGTDWSTIPHCEPICMPSCQNNGICFAPDQCNCQENFSGPQCQFENKPCLDSLPSVLNSHKHCDSKFCTVTCLKNFVYPDGSSIANLVCESGNWVPTRTDWVSIPDCTPVCNPPCQNGGICLPRNICQCPQEFRGPQCQYSMNVCSSEKLNFNGGISCIGSENINSCKLNCPLGIDFEFEPADAYICNYDTGVFLPQPIPQCIVDYSINIHVDSTLYNSYVHKSNFTWSFENMFESNEENDSSDLFESNEENDSSDLFELYRDDEMMEDLFEMLDNNLVVIEEKRPEPKTCFTWGGAHYKTFDDQIFNFDSNCNHIMLQEKNNAILTIAVQNSPSCQTEFRCFRIIQFFIGEKEYTLSRNEKDIPEFRSIKKSFPIPVQLPGLRVEMSAHFIIVYVDSLGVKLKWDGAFLVQIDASETMWNRTVGLCGRMNGDPNDDLIGKTGNHPTSIKALANSWEVEDIGETCNENPKEQHSCPSHSQLAQEAYEFCSQLLSDNKFRSCSNTLKISDLELACVWDYCACNDLDKRTCACETMNVYVRQCAHKGIVSLAGWRNEDLCSMQCTKGRIYMPCGPKAQPSCGSDIEFNINDADCEEGCFCPKGTLMHEDKCVPQEECPCRLRGKLFHPGASVAKDCNTCTCTSGKWICTQVQCSARCAIIGDPHYTTFDGKHYDFMGKCKYYLLKGEDYSIESKNVACSGAISESLGFTPSDTPSCTKTVTIRTEKTTIQLKQDKQLVINGEDISKLPLSVNGIKIQAASSIFLVVRMLNGLEVWWDGISRVYINAPAEFHSKTKGLCGTFSNNQKDDFITPDGDIEQVVTLFANKWKTNEQCLDVHEREPKHPCDLNPQKREFAKEYCSKLYTDIFADCHWYVEPEVFYKDCLYDMCTCTTDIKKCFCPILSAYAKDCAAAGVKLFWRNEVQECSLQCPGGQVYQICGNSCKRSCGDISFNPDCKEECVEGCNCPEGQTLDIMGECIPIGQCPCIYSGIEFKAGYQEIRPGQKGQDLCTCIGGKWDCKLATSEELKKRQSANNTSVHCSATKNLELTDCEPVKQRTCYNMHIPVTESPITCQQGCICKSGYVLDVINGVCIKEDECPCHHGGKSYKDGSIIQSDCNTCQCASGKWNCTDRICAGVCSAWGDSHYETFDGKLFNFQGVCDYILAKGALSKEETFYISTQNVPCGTTGVSCSKSITLKVGQGTNQESITLTKGKALPKGNFKRIAIRTVGLFVFLDVPDLGLVLQWDKGTRVYIRLNPKWKGHMKGLCGDYNDNSEDDFKTPSGGISEVSSNLFGDSWKINDFCPEPKDIKDPCEQHPERKLWAIEKCNILKSDLFRSCHSEVDIEFYVKNCIFDTCSCDTGGDCECLCTSLAAYAQQCNAKGVPIKWRSQDLCPIQCDKECSSYSPCISTCPHETCDNLLTIKDNLHLCSQDACIEGCLFKPCANDYVYKDANYTECIPKATCKPICAEINGTVFFEGDEVSNDDCKTCFCSRGKVICQGGPCVTVPTTPIIPTIPLEEPLKCIDGWTAWINKDQNVKGVKLNDIEPLPNWTDLASIEGSVICTKEQMIDIQCRSVKNHLSPKESGLDVECSLERGLYCKSHTDLPCLDFEISVLCQCSPETTSTSTTVLTSTEILNNNVCEENSYKKHPTDCHIFYQCVYNVWVEKTCGSDMFYNSNFNVCDWPANVVLVRPECYIKQTTPSKQTQWTQNTTTSYGNTLITTEEKKVTTTRLCKVDETWNDCAVKCSQTCEYYRFSLSEQDLCKGDTDCIPGCVSSKRTECPSSKFWKDFETCVDSNDCNCKSHNGESIKPGNVVKESECEICQCIHNYYTCDKTVCTNVAHQVEPSSSTFTPTLNYEEKLSTLITTEENIIIVTSTVTPPEQCDSGNYIPLIQQSATNEVSFNASSSNGNEFQPGNAVFDNKITKKPIRSWQPYFVDKHQWLTIEFQHPLPIYGIILKGSPIDDKFVTSYQILFSDDGYAFSYVKDNTNEPRIFRGPVDSIKAVEQKFYEPIEAKIIQINPLTWHNGIAIKVELLGCEEDVIEATTVPEILSTTTEFFDTTTVFEKIINPVCEDSMGLDNGLMSDTQISASSSFDNLLPNLQLSAPGIWRPKLDNLNQYVQFDFLEPRNITGIQTKGDNNIWTTVYKIFYSIDGHQWNPIINDDNIEVEFLGNFDSINIKTNLFERPLRTRYLKIQPIKWHEHIGLKVEVLGCFLPYPVVTTELPTSTEQIVTECNTCDGILIENTTTCNCDQSLWWNGETCVSKQNCPCVVGHISYAVGSIYESENCQQCSCTLGGISSCIPKKCEPCLEPGMQSVITELCSCICKPCQYGTRYCPTSNICLNETLWCNGVQDCPDDEKDCPKIETSSSHFDFTDEVKYTTTPIPTKTTVQVPSVQCEEPTCPIGYKTVIRDGWNKRHSSKAFNNVYEHTFIDNKNIFTKGKRRPTKYSTKQNYRKSWKYHESVNHDIYNSQRSMVCPHFTCVPIKPPLAFGGINIPEHCPEVACPPSYTIKYEKMSMYKIEKCRKYTCEPPVPLEAICNVTGRTFNTFDNLEYKYDICNHILARDMYGNKWYITLEKLCEGIQCSRNLAIFIDDEVIVLYPDMHIDINDYTYTSNQVARLGDKFKLFKVSRVGDTIYLICDHYGFWVMWNTDTNIKIGINKKLNSLVDGLCGYFDGNILNDKQMPDGRQSKSTVEFGNSWIMEGALQCESQVCPYDIKEQGWKLCNMIKDRSFAICSDVVDLEKFLSRCLETACTCLRSKSTYDDCRCRTLTTFVTECQANNQNIDLSTWRNIYDCPGNCSAPFVHKDCFRNKCERSCNDLQEVDPCPIMEGVCFSGCFCPEGTVRNGDNCIPTSECRDCICEGFGNSFISFDRTNFTFEGNCTYILSRDIVNEANSKHKNHTYQILVSNIICDTGICTEGIIVLYESHVIKIFQIPTERSLVEINVDNTIVNTLPYETHWLKFEETPGKYLKLLIPAIQLEITITQPNFAFTIRVPSRIFGDAIEGLCGNCNNDIEDDLKQQDGKITNNVEQFGKSWLVNSLPFDYHLDIQNCISKQSKQEPICNQLGENDSCNQILSTVFAQCHDLVDPDPYLSICQDSLCMGKDYCDNIAAYARKCAEVGLCINWRTYDICPYTCPPHLQYKPCGFGCTCDNINAENNEICNVQFEEGCFCPENYVLHNNTCIEQKKCLVCDEDGHIEGDIWYSDKCTTCTCQKKRVNCQKTECPTLDTICEENMTPKLVSGTETDCCPKYLCIAATESPLCEEMQQPECGFGQVMKLHTDTKGCKKIVCECLSTEECPALEDIELEIELMEPGMVTEMNTSGCCPKISRICNPLTCPPPPVCPDYYILSKKPLKSACCSHYECKPPKDICIYNATSNTGSQYVISKTIGEEWKENNCRTCVCENSDLGPEIKCLTVKCPDVTIHPDISDFVMEEILLNDECCPSLKRIACKEGDQIYKVGETWKPDQEDACITKECIEDSNNIQKQIKVQNCNVSCEYGYEYQPSNDKSNDCCGKCVAIGCVVNKEIKNIGEQWYSTDNCVTYSCQSVNGSLYIHSVTEKCPEINLIDEEEYVIEKYFLPDTCCPVTVKTACRDNGRIYQIGEQWKHPTNDCITQICTSKDNGAIKASDYKTCSEDCPMGWKYQAPIDDKCCGECQQMYCVYENMLYEPDETWSSDDNCTTYTCLEKDNQFMIIRSSVDCPDVTHCPKESLYNDGCCQKCNLPSLNSQTGNCILNTMNSSDTIGIFIKESEIYGICTNLKPIEGITNCAGTCQSGTDLDKETWMQFNYCECCQAKEYRDFAIELTCENGAKVSEKIMLPISCSCDTCASIK